ncbi:BMP family ABC transporter substrate-binding protein [Undibacterium arcticum]|uniref:BMP family ABC transporter substrate-binding protein n=1 Tax=Undibacterium arcticum TaxID=1762892 RepID=A0ABV7F3B1_9BURK
MLILNRRDFLKQVSAVGITVATGGRALDAFADDVLKVAVAYVSPIGDVGWTKQHDLARRAMEAAFPGKIKTTTIEGVAQAQDAERVFRDLATQGNKLIIGTSFSHMNPMLKVAQTMPQTKFELCSGIKTLKNLGAFEARYYEGTYLAGIVAGKMSKSNVLGFVGGFPVPDVVGPANAFLLGARSVNPKIICKTIWLDSWYDPGKERDAANALISQGADVVMSMTDTPTTVQVGEEKGVWTIGYASDMSKYGPKKHLTSFVLDWSSDYISAASEVMAGTWVANHRWDGLKAGVVKMSPYNSAIPKDALSYVAAQERAIIAGQLHPFAGPIRDQDGKQRVASGAVLPDDQIKGINWFVEGMQGNLPKG